METGRINSVTAQQMREQLSDLLNRAAYLHEPTLVTRQGKAVAVLVSVGEWEKYLELQADEARRETEGQRMESEQGNVGSENGRE